MKFQWIITNDDIGLLKDFVFENIDNNFVRSRMLKNLINIPSPIKKDEFWKWMISCLLTTQQRSGPDSKISKFINTKPFPLNYSFCFESKNLVVDTYRILSSYGGIRRTNKISEEIEYNFSWLENGGWSMVFEVLNELYSLREKKPDSQNIVIERKACLVTQNLKGIGPKQSRNLLQALGLTRFEIPIDSRIIKWLNKNGFPLKLSASGMSDENYYQFIMSGIQEWCNQASVIPCVLDAAIFSSYDEEWPENNEIW
jgi:thermostable 8-oxoguanine DNA glycosylase